MDKMWAGRFSKALDKQADDFNSSLRFDCRMYREDIEGSMAHAAMLGEKKIISSEDAALIIKTALNITLVIFLSIVSSLYSPKKPLTFLRFFKYK